MNALPDITEHLHIKQGFCYPDWSAISTRIEETLPKSEWNSAWEAASRAWVERIRDQLGGKHQVYETANFLILSEAPMRVIKDACRSYEESLKRCLLFSFYCRLCFSFLPIASSNRQLTAIDSPQ